MPTICLTRAGSNSSSSGSASYAASKKKLSGLAGS